MVSGSQPIVAAPWAIDSAGSQRATHYEILSGGIIRQHVDLKGASFPVTADPSWWWWTKTVANCAGALAPLAGLAGPAIASKFPKIIKAIQAEESIPKISKAIRDAGGLQEAAQLALKVAVNSIHDKLPSFARGAFPRFDLGSKKLVGSVIFGFIWNQFWDLLGVGSCGQIIKELSK